MTTKEKVYRRLLDADGNLVSGESLAEELSLSRVAIWKAVKALQEEGVSIESAKGGGYRITGPSYDQASLERLMPVPVYFYEETDSTNNEARRLSNTGIKAPYVVIARRQSGGKGRRGRSFISDEGGIYLSLVVPAGDMESVETLTTRVALAISRAIDSLGFESSIKWVNDIYVDGKKVVGILCEGFVSMEEMRVEEVVLGIGVNYETRSFPEELKDVAGSLYPEGGAPIGKGEFAAREVKEILSAIAEENYIEEYRAKCFVIGKDVNVIKPTGSVPAHALDVDDRAHLVVRYEDGSTEALSSGEVTIRLR